MKIFKIVLVVIALFTLNVQLVRHGYVRYFYNHESVLDKYNKKNIDYQIEKIESLDELTKKYDLLDEQIKKLEEGKTQKQINGIKKSEDPYYSHNKIEKAITDWEAKQAKIKEIRIFWFAGLALIIIGLIVYIRIELWAGIAFIISGISEMIWWTSPSFVGEGTRSEFLRLLNTKLLYTALTLVLVLLLWYIDKKIYKKLK